MTFDDMTVCRWFTCLYVLVLASCASRPPAFREQGWASYVADQYTGRPTASGQLYYPQAYTAAHTSLPFGTVVTVKNSLTGRKVNVTVNDRFPYYPGRVINLSSAAAQEIGIPYMQMGQVEVTAETLPGGAGYGQGQGQGYANYAPQGGGRGGYGAGAPPAYSSSPPSSYGGGYGAGTGAYSPQPGYPPNQPAGYPSQAPAATYMTQPPAGGYGAAPSAPSFSGGNATPPGLRTF